MLERALTRSFSLPVLLAGSNCEFTGTLIALTSVIRGAFGVFLAGRARRKSARSFSREVTFELVAATSFRSVISFSRADNFVTGTSLEAS